MATMDVKGLKYISCDFRARSYARNYAASLPTGLPDSQIWHGTKKVDRVSITGLHLDKEDAMVFKKYMAIK